MTEGAPVDLSALKKLPIASELVKLERWFATLWAPKRPPARSNAIYFGIVELEDGAHDFHCMALPGSEPSTEDWKFAEGLAPKQEYAASGVLAALSHERGPSAKSAQARHLLILAYTALVAAHLCRAQLRVLAARKPLVAAGYDEGDVVALGRLQADGKLQPPAPPKPGASAAKAGKLPADVQLFRFKDTKTAGGAWMLDGPLAPGRDFNHGFATSGKRIKPAPYTAKMAVKGKPIDISVTLIDALIVRTKVADLFSKLDAASIQRVPISVEGSKERFEILNVLSKVPPKQLLASIKGSKLPVSQGSLGKPKIALTGPALTVVVVNRDVADALTAAGTTGIKLVPLERDDLK